MSLAINGRLCTCIICIISFFRCLISILDDPFSQIIFLVLFSMLCFIQHSVKKCYIPQEVYLHTFWTNYALLTSPFLKSFFFSSSVLKLVDHRDLVGHAFSTIFEYVLTPYIHNKLRIGCCLIYSQLNYVSGCYSQSTI